MRLTLFRDLRGQRAEERQHRRGRPDQSGLINIEPSIPAATSALSRRARTISPHVRAQSGFVQPSHPCDCKHGKHGLSRPRRALGPGLAPQQRPPAVERATIPVGSGSHLRTRTWRPSRATPAVSRRDSAGVDRDNLSLRWNRNALISPDRIPPPGRVTPPRLFCR